MSLTVADQKSERVGMASLEDVVKNQKPGVLGSKFTHIPLFFSSLKFNDLGVAVHLFDDEMWEIYFRIPELNFPRRCSRN
jgi:hypothetical protein